MNQQALAISIIGLLALISVAIPWCPAAEPDQQARVDRFSVALFRFDEPGATSFDDASGRGATLSLGTTASYSEEGRFGGALRLRPRGSDGESRTAIRLPEGALGRSGFSIDFWVKIHNEGFWPKRDIYLLSSPNCFFRFSVDRNSLELGVRTQDGWRGVGTDKKTFRAQPNRWFHLAGTHDGAEVRFYIDGKLMAKTPARGLVRQTSYFLGAVGWTHHLRSELDGWIDDVRFSAIARPDFDQVDKAGKAFPTTVGPDPPPFIPGVPMVVVVKVDEPPPIGGSPTGGVWAKAAWVGNPVYANEWRITDKLDVRAGLLWDDTALYVGFNVTQNRWPVAVTQTKGDDGLERDDAVEVCFIAPGYKQARGAPVQFKLNCVGQRDDAIHFDFKWNAEWDGAVKTEDNSWSATFKIPFANFGATPREGDQWDANLAAFLVGYKYRGFLWSPIYSHYHHHDGEWGRLVFGSINIPASSIESIRRDLSSVSCRGVLASRGKVRMLLFSESGPAKKQVLLGGHVIANFEGEERRAAVASTEVRVDQPGPWSLSLESIHPGRYFVKVTVMDEADRVLNVDVKPVTINRSMEVQVLKYPVARSGSAIVKVYDMGRSGVLPAPLELTVLDEKGAVLHAFKAKMPARLPSRKILSLGPLVNEARYKVTARAMAADGRATVEDAVEFTLPKRPAWADTKAGALNGKVLEPWTPIEAQGETLKCWGRAYKLGNSLMPEAITSSEHPILAEPIRVIAGSGEEISDLSLAMDAPDIMVSPTGDRADFESVSDSALCAVALRGSLEFDGFMTLAVTVRPKRSISRFAIEIPINPTVARYMQPLPGVSNRDRAGTIPNTGVKLGPTRTLWICNEDIGLFWARGSTQFWTAPPGQAIELIPSEKNTLLRINFYRLDEGFRTERTYRFHIQATPVRPYNPEWFAKDCRIAGGLNWRFNLKALEDDTVRSVPFAEAAASPQGSFEILFQNQSDLKGFIGMKIEKFGLRRGGVDEKYLSIAADAGSVSLLYSRERRALTLKTPWGELGKPENCAWSPGETHKLAFTWGDKLRFYVDGGVQGELDVRGLPLPSATLKLGSVRAHAVLQGLRVSRSQDAPAVADVSAMPKTEETLLYRAEALDLHSAARTPLHVFKELGGRTLHYHEDWCHVQGGGRSEFEPVLRNLVADCHRIGLKVIFYFGFQMPDAPEYKDMIDECKASVDAKPSWYGAGMNMNTYGVNYGGPYQEFLLHHVQRLKEEIGIDGVYLDGTLGLVASDHPAYGCGYEDKNGGRVATIPIERIRQFAMRINNLFVQEGGIVKAHLGMCPPTMGFVTCTYLGEHVGFLNTDWESVPDRIPLDVSRSIYSGKNTGVPMVLCIQNMHPHLRSIRPHWFPRSLAWALLHRVDINVLLESPMAKEGRTVMAVNRMLSEFGADQAEWIPYWETQRMATYEPKDIAMSVYRRPDGAMVCVIANLSGRDVSGWVDFSSNERLRLKPGIRLREWPSGKAVSVQDGKAHFTIPAYECRLVRDDAGR